MSFFSGLKREQLQWSEVSTESGYVVDPRMGDAIDPKVEKKKEDEVKFYPLSHERGSVLASVEHSAMLTQTTSINLCHILHFLSFNNPCLSVSPLSTLISLSVLCSILLNFQASAKRLRRGGHNFESSVLTTATYMHIANLGLDKGPHLQMLPLPHLTQLPLLILHPVQACISIVLVLGYQCHL